MNWMQFIFGVLKSPITWLAFAIICIGCYTFFPRLRLPEQLNISKILTEYKKVFKAKKDLTFFVVLPLFLAISTNLKVKADDEILGTMCVIISILAASVISFMAMTSERADTIIEKQPTERNRSDKRNIQRSQESLAIGMCEILISITLLVLIFLSPIFDAQSHMYWCISLLIYFGFYVFLLNLFIMMRRLQQIYRIGL